ncbi:MAG: cell surface protein [Planctomycetota bacterium]
MSFRVDDESGVFWTTFRLTVLLSVWTLTLSMARGEEGEYLGPIDVVAGPSGEVLYVVQHDAERIDVLDIESREVQRSIACPAPPSGLAISEDGHELYITCEGSPGVVCVADGDAGKITKKIPVGHTPNGPTLIPDRRKLVVCNRFDDDVSIVSLEEGKEVDRVPVLREPVASAVTPDGGTVLVSNLLPVDPADATTVAAEVSLISMADRSTTSVRLPNGSSSVRDVCVSPDGQYAYVVHILSRYRMPTTQLERGWMNTNALSVIDVPDQKLINTVLLDEIDLGAANPYAVKTSSDGARIFVSHAGSHELSVIDAKKMLEKLAAVPKTMDEAREEGRTDTSGTYSSTTVVDVPNDLAFLVDLRERIRLRKRWMPGLVSEEQSLLKGPRGFDVIGSKVYIAVYFGDALAMVDLETKRHDKVSVIRLGPEPELTMVRRGEMFFHDADICFQQWQSCSSCHPDARVDSLNWDLMNDGIGNPKNAKSMLLSHETPPSMSLGVRGTAEDAVRAGIRHIQFAVPPEEDKAPESIDEYLKRLEALPSPRLVDGELSESAERGKKLFFSERIGCGICHPEPLYTDMKMHDVGSRSELDRQNEFDTPTLIEVWRTAPYMHDGQYTSIKQLITEGEHGASVGDLESLTEKELNDLVEFVLSL